MSGSLIVALLILIAHHVSPVGAWLVLVSVCMLAQLEFYKLLNLPAIPVYRYLGVLCGGAMVTVTFFTIGAPVGGPLGAYRWEHLVMTVSLALIFVRQLFQRDHEQSLVTIACTLLGILYIPYLFNFFTRLAFTWDGSFADARVGRTGRLLILYLVVVVKSNDIGAFVVGSAVGRRPFMPHLSPRKTWEGVMGGLGFALAGSLLFVHSVTGDFGAITLGMSDALALGFLLCLAGTAGDLFESLVKRASGTKDSGTSVPGMGGLLDVLDSLLFGAPVLFFYVHLMG